jgi:predicted transcriptional regulator
MEQLDSLIRLNRKELGNYFHELIKEKNYTIEEFARTCGMSKKTVYNIIQGRGYNIDSFLTLLIVLDIDTGTILEAFFGCYQNL